MKMLNHTFFACLLGMSLVSCSHAQQQKTKEFRLPDVPVTLTAPEDRAAYLSLHYWDHFDFADTSLISRPEITEQAFVDFLGILPYTDRAQAAIDTLFRRAATGQEMLYHFIGLSDKYLYEPNSPMHDEELHILVLRALLDNPCLSDTDKIRPRYLLEIAMKNRPGDVAADFTVTCRDGRRRQLSGIKAVTNIHRRTFANSFQAFQNLNVTRRVIICVVLIFCHFSIVLFPCKDTKKS